MCLGIGFYQMSTVSTDSFSSMIFIISISENIFSLFMF